MWPGPHHAHVRSNPRQFCLCKLQGSRWSPPNLGLIEITALRPRTLFVANLLNFHYARSTPKKTSDTVDRPALISASKKKSQDDTAAQPECRMRAFHSRKMLYAQKRGRFARNVLYRLNILNFLKESPEHRLQDDNPPSYTRGIYMVI